MSWRNPTLPAKPPCSLCFGTMGVKGFFQNSRDFFASEVDSAELSPEGKEALRLDTRVWIADGMTVLTRLCHRVARNTDPEAKKKAFYIAFRDYLLDTTETHPALGLLLFVCDRSDRVTSMKAKTQQKRSRASLSATASGPPGPSGPSGPSAAPSSTEILRLHDNLSLCAQTHLLAVVEGPGEKTGLPGLCAHDLLHVRKHRRVLFEYLVRCLRGDAVFASRLLARKPGFALLFDVGGRDQDGQGTTYFCQIEPTGSGGPSAPPSLAWSERSRGFWAGAEEGEADLTCWEWYARLCSGAEGRSFLGTSGAEESGKAVKGLAQGPRSSVVIETIDTDLVLIGLLLTWQQAHGVGRAGSLSGTPPCFLHFTNRFTWDVRALFRSLCGPAGPSTSRESGDHRLLAFLWAHMTQGTDFCEKRDLSDRVNFGNVLRAVRAYLPRHQALCALRPGIGGSALFHPASFEEFLRLLCGFFPAPRADPLALARAKRGASGLQLLGCCLALSREKRDKQGRPSWSGMAPMPILREAYVTWRCSVEYWFERRDPLRCSRASVESWRREASAWCRREVEAETRARAGAEEEVRARLARLQAKTPPTTPANPLRPGKKEGRAENTAAPAAPKKEAQPAPTKRRFRPLSERPVLSSGWVAVKKHKSKKKAFFKAKS